MAEKKRKPAAKSTSSRSGSGKSGTTSSAKSKTGKTSRAKSGKSGSKRRSKKKKQEELTQSLILSGVGVLLIVMLFVPGESVWQMLRTALFGVFGVGMYVLGLVCIYLGVCLAQGKRLMPEISKAAVGLFTLSGVVTVFSTLDTTGLPDFWSVLTAYYEQGAGMVFGGGVAGLPVGGLLLYLCGRPAANVIMVVLMICALMVIFGISPAEIWEMIHYYGQRFVDGQKSVLAETKEGYHRRREELLERQQVYQMEMEDVLEPKKEEVEPGEGLFGKIGQFFSDIWFGMDDYDDEEPEAPSAVPQLQGSTEVRAVSNRRSVMETALHNAERAPFDVQKETDLWPSAPVQPEAPVQEPDYILPDSNGAAPAPQAAPAVPEQAAAPQPQPITPAPQAVVPDTPPVTVVRPQTPDGPGPSRIVPDPLEDDEEWMSIDAQPPVSARQSVAIEHLTDAAMGKAAAAEQMAAAAPAPETEKSAPAVYRYPPLSLFDPQQEEPEDARMELKANAEKLVSTLESFGVQTRILDISRGPSVTRYELQPRAGVKISRITNLADDIALNLAVADVRIEAPIPGKPAVGIEVPNRKRTSVSIRSILESANYSHMASPLTITLGKDIAGVAQVADLCKMPHLLIAGSTGSGKSVCVNSIIISFIYRSSPEDLKLLLIDPKVVELAEYNGIPHLLMPVVTEPRKAAGALCSAVGEMERRYRLFADNNVRDIKSFNKLAAENPSLEKLPYIAIIIDELADLMMVAGKEVEDYICRIAQKARAAGMHLVVATQRPSVDVITGLIKANIPSRIAFAVSSQVDSRTILDGAGAEKLLGYGDMLFMPVGAPKPIRIQGTFVNDAEITRTLDFIKAEQKAEYDQGMIDAMEKAANDNGKSGGGSGGGDEETDPMFSQCVECVIDAGQASTSLLQRRCKLGYARAARIMDEMEEKGIIGPYEGAKPRAVLISRQQWLEMNISRDGTAPAL